MTIENVIAIDGPSGSGKSTVAKKVATQLGALYIDSGAMFRAIGYSFSKHGLNEEGTELSSKAEEILNLSYFDYKHEQDAFIFAEGEDVSSKIREHHVSLLASNVSKIPAVRKFVAHWQHHLVENQLCVLEGRDIGTVIFPNAKLKVFLTASIECRAKRRFEELKNRSKENFQLDYQTIYNDIEKRDLQDSTRALDPLKKADDAIEIDTSDMSVQDVIDVIVELFKQRSASHDSLI